MNKDKQQIEALSNDLLKSEFWRFDEECNRFELDRTKTARNLHRKGYRKAEDIAREIFAEIEDVLNNIGYFDEIDFKALKKKYTEAANDL
jgi:hypothetical protein